MKTLTYAATTLALGSTLAACTGSDHTDTFQTAMTTHSKAPQVCQQAFGSDQNTLAQLDPGDLSVSRYSVTGLWDNTLECIISGAESHHVITVSTHNGSARGDLVAHTGDVWAWAKSDPHAPFSAKAHGVLTDAVAKLAK